MLGLTVSKPTQKHLGQSEIPDYNIQKRKSPSYWRFPADSNLRWCKGSLFTWRGVQAHWKWSHRTLLSIKKSTGCGCSIAVTPNTTTGTWHCRHGFCSWIMGELFDHVSAASRATPWRFRVLGGSKRMRSKLAIAVLVHLVFRHTVHVLWISGICVRRKKNPHLYSRDMSWRTSDVWKSLQWCGWVDPFELSS